MSRTDSQDSGLFNRSYDFNQSYPSVGTSGKAFMSKLLLTPLTKANGLNSLSMSGGFGPLNPAMNANQSLDQSAWSFYSFVRNEPVAGSRNPHKAVFSLDSKTSRILIANKLGCRLLGVTAEEIAGGKVRLKTFIREYKNRAALTEMEVNNKGDPVVFSGNVVELTLRDGKSVLVSLWVRLLGADSDRNLLSPVSATHKVAVAVAEPVIRADAVIQLSANRKVVWFDSVAKEVFDLDDEHIGVLDASEIAPKLELDSGQPCDDGSVEGAPQAIVVKRVGGYSSFPASVGVYESADLAAVCEARPAKDFPPKGFDFGLGTHVLIVSVYGNLSGLALVDESGKIVDVNPNFALLTFGRHRDALVGQDVRLMLPTFYRDCEVEDTDSMPMPDFDDHKSVPLESTPVSKSKSNGNGNGSHADFSPTSFSPTTARRFVDGTYSGTGVHSDGTPLSVAYHVQFSKELDGVRVYCVWISATSEVSAAGLSESMRKVRGSDVSHGASTSFDDLGSGGLTFGQYLLNARKKRWSVDEEELLAEEDPKDEKPKFEVWDNEISENEGDPEDESDLVAGRYSRAYDVLESVGKGAFGCVKLSRPKGKADSITVTKFITKKSVHPSCRVKLDTNAKKSSFPGVEAGWVPTEVDILLRLDHPNVVKATDVFSNDRFFQLVMKRHGVAIMDLFDFIEKRKTEEMPEDLAHHIFAQMLEGLRYLHEDQKIVHRDIKDENVILNERFDAQLIDFGSAAPIPPSTNKTVSLFYTFCGTYQYCSPEVIMGNPYRGPELEIWSTGVTLFTMMFRDNPFSTPEEIVESPLHFQYKLSVPLKSLITGMLVKDPKMRLTLRQCLSHLWMTSMEPWSKKERILSRYSLRDFVQHDGEFEKLPKIEEKPSGKKFDPLFDCPEIIQRGGGDVDGPLLVTSELNEAMNMLTLDSDEGSEDSFS